MYICQSSFSNQRNTIISTFKQDIPSSIVVFFVALPLCLGIALASNAPLFSGLIAGIVGGIVVGFLSNSSLGVSGPAAGLTAIVSAAILTLGSYQSFLLAVVLAGLIQVILGVLRAGIIGYYFPSSVIKGMLSGIGIIIILKQIPHFFGWDADPEGDWAFIQIDGQNTFSEILYSINHITPGSLIIGAVGLAIIIYWDNILAKTHTIFKLIQGPIVAVVLGVIYVLIFDGHELLGISKSHLVNVPTPSNFDEFKAIFTFPDFSLIQTKQIWIVAFTLALVASLETLLSVEATDKLDPHKRVTNPNRELFAQGSANIISGLIGGLPVTQVIVRSSANVQSGGQTKKSAIIHGFLLIAAVLIIPSIINLIPLSVLASVLLVVGYKLAKPKLFKDMFKLGVTQYLPYIATIAVIVGKDLLWGIGVGFVLSTFFVLYKSFKNTISFRKNTSLLDEGTLKITFAEELSFLNKAKLQQELDLIPENTILEMDIRGNKAIDYDVIDVLEDFLVKAKEKNIIVQLLTSKGDINNPSTFLEYLDANRRSYEAI